jgi:hypothetical protein
MSRNLRDPKIEAPAQQEGPGLDPEELRAEQAGDLPDRDALSIIGVGGLEGGLPPAGLLDGLLESDVPVQTVPVDGLPVEQYPVDQLPIERLPVDPLPPEEIPGHGLPVEPPVITLPVDPPILVDQPVDSLPVEPPADGDPIGVPDPPATAADASVKA